MNSDGELTEEQFRPITTEENGRRTGNFGITLPPAEAALKSEIPRSPDDSIIIAINSGSTEEEQAETLSHEGYGHAYLYSQGKDDEHDYVNEFDSDSPPGQLNFIMVERNEELGKAINRAVEETKQNMEEARKDE